MRNICIIIAIMASAAAQAQNLTLEECVVLADRNNVSLRSARGDVEVSKIMQSTAWDIAGTELSLSQDPTSGASPDNSLSLSQTIEFPTRYVARRRLLKAETGTKQAEVSVLSNQLRGAVASLYYTLVYQRAKLSILQGKDTILRHYEDIAAKRYEAGEVRQLEPLNARRLVGENKIEMDLVKTEYANTQSELALLLDSDIAVEPSVQRLEPLVVDVADTYDYAHTPEGRLADSNLRAAGEAVRVERSAFAPNLTLALRTQMVIKGWNPYNVDRSWNDGNFMGFEVGIGIPVFTGATRARVKAARRELDLRKLRQAGEKRRLQSEYTVALSRLEAARRQLEYYTTTGGDEAAKTADISALAYESGEISYIEYVSAVWQSVDTSLRHAAAVNDYNQAAIKIKTLRGDREF